MMEKMNGKSMPWKWMAYGVLLTLGVYLALLMLCAYLTLRGALPESALERSVWVCACVAALAGALFVRLQKGTGALAVILSTAGFCAVVVLLGFLLHDTVQLNSLVHLLTASAVGDAAVLFALRKRGGKGKKRKGRRVRR